MALALDSMALGIESFTPKALARANETRAESPQWVYSADMKRLILVPLVLIAITLVVSAQSTQRGPVRG